MSRTASTPTGSGTTGCSWSGEPSGTPEWWSFPTPPAVSSAGSSGGPPTQTGRPGSRLCPAPSRCLGWGVSTLRRPGRSSPRGVFDWLALTGWGLPAVAALGTQGVERVASALRGCPRVFLAFDNDDAGREATGQLQTLLERRAAAVALPEGVGDVAELAALSQGRAAFLRLLTQAARSAR